MTTRADRVPTLAEALRAVRDAVAATSYPLPLPSALPARSQTRALLAELEDYCLPRLTYLAAPLLVVVSGSTGAGKSTLVNSLVQAPVSLSGVLRPTTREPVLVCHPSDTPWFRGDRRLPGLTRQSSVRTPPPAPARSKEGPPPLRLIAAPALPPGLAFLDSPDLDSVEAGNRALARRLLTSGDLWLFVTTPQRYADALPWGLLHTARERRAATAVVLSRVQPAAMTEMIGLVSQLLASNGLGDVPVFAVPETRLDRQGLLPDPALASLRGWFDALAADAATRHQMVRSTLDGALAALPARLLALAAAAEEQVAAGVELAEQVGLAYGIARGTIERAVRASGFAAPVPAPASSPHPEADRTDERPEPSEPDLIALVRSALADANEQIDIAWQAHPAGAGLLAGQPSVEPPELAEQLPQIIREYHGEELVARLGQLLDEQAARWLDRLTEVPPSPEPAQRLHAAAAMLEQARQAAGLLDGPGGIPSPRVAARAAVPGQPSAGDQPASEPVGEGSR